MFYLITMNNQKCVSASQLQCYNDCPQWWYWNYELKLMQQENDAFIIGNAYHKALELFHIADCNKQTIASLIEQMKPTLIKVSEKGNDLESFIMFKTMFKKYAENILTGKTLKCEETFSLKIEGVPIPLFGKIDRVDEDKIVDYKTSSYDFKQENIETIQSKIYSYAVNEIYKKLLPVVYSVMHKRKAEKDSYKPQVLKIQYTLDEIKEIPNIVRKFYNNTVSGNFEPKKGQHCYYCPYGRKGTNNCKCSI